MAEKPEIAADTRGEGEAGRTLTAVRQASSTGVVADTGDAAADLPGDPPCWLCRVCPACGGIDDTYPPTTCPQCGAEIERY